MIPFKAGSVLDSRLTLNGYYDKMKSGRRAGRVYVKHIFKYLPQNISGHTLREMESRMDSIYRALAKEGGAVPSFDACVEQFSDEKKAFWVGWLQMPVEFEDIVFGLNAGEISRPFLTPQGIHIVKVLEQQEILPFERMKDKNNPLSNPSSWEWIKERGLCG